MKTTIIVFVSLLIGSAVGGVLTLGFGAGMGAASGMLFGSQVGVCLAMETAEEQALVSTPDARDRFIVTTIGKIREKSQGVPARASIEWISDAEGCQDILRQVGPGSQAATKP